MQLEPSADTVNKPEPDGSARQPGAGSRVSGSTISGSTISGSTVSGYPEERAELEWILSHPEISRSANLVRFLSFICAKFFDGDAKDIREHTIATEALGRKPSNFDSHADPIVRVTARTLRKKLQTLYETDGLSHRLQIVLPLGHYVPQFDYRPQPPASVAELVELPLAEEAEVPPAPASAAPESARPVAVVAGKSLASKVPIVLKFAAFAGVVAAVFAVGFLSGRHQSQPQRPPGEAFKWGDPTWSDEFDGAARQLPDSTKWAYDLEDQLGIGDKEREVYCGPGGSAAKSCDPRHPNAFLDGDGHLVLRAQKNSAGVWTLVRVTTKRLKSFQYGRIEARMKLPVGKGLWPSFIMDGANKDSVGWPNSGSVDIAENVSLSPGSNGLGPTMIRSTMHGPRYFGSNGLWHDYKLPNGARVDDGSFHTYGIIWSPGMVQFYFDDPANVYIVHDTGDLPEGGVWVFDHPFYLMMSLAIGGDWAGDSDASTPNPADILVDYVRAYKIPTVAAPRIEWQPVPIKAGASATSTVALRSPGYAGRVHLDCSTDTPNVACSLATSVLNFSDTLSQEDTLTLTTNLFTEKGRVTAPPGRYNVTVTATTISGDRSQLTMPFEVRSED
jgi:beta-glucanase (GH16 family)